VVGLGDVGGVGLAADLEVVGPEARRRQRVGGVGELQGEGEVGVDDGTLPGAVGGWSDVRAARREARRMDRTSAVARRALAATLGVGLACSLAACDGSGSKTAPTSSTTRARRSHRTTTTTTTGVAPTSTTAPSPPTTVGTIPSGQTGPGGTNPPATADCGVELGRFTAVIDSGELGDVPVGSYDITDCRLAPSRPIWGAVAMQPRAGTSVPALTVVFERIGSIWNVHAHGPGPTGCDAPAPVPTELRLGC
jgi:hypothetical protein